MLTSMKICINHWLWLMPFLLYVGDAHAFGLATHLYFAQSLIWAMPLLDKRLTAAIKKFPELVMAGALLPDLAIISRKYRNTHDWRHVHDLLQSAVCDEQIAIAVGYASHLYIDVIAHNHFVPAHEAMWLDKGMFTHITSEWAMDAHLSPLLDDLPGSLLRKHINLLSAFIAPNFKCSVPETRKLILRLSYLDDLLRVLKIPNFIYRCSRSLDKRVSQHFIYYIAKTQIAIADIGLVLSGNTPAWEAELMQLESHTISAWRLECLSDLALLHPSPIRHFAASAFKKN